MDNKELDYLAAKVADHLRTPLVVDQNQISNMLGFSCISTVVPPEKVV